MSKTQIESIKDKIICLIQDQVKHLETEKTKFLSGQQSTGKYSLLDILDGLNGSVYALEHLAAEINNLDGGDLNYCNLTRTIINAFSVKYETLTWNVFSRTLEHIHLPYKNVLVLLFSKYLRDLMRNVLIDVECQINDEIERFEERKVGLAIITNPTIEACVDFLGSQLSRKKTDSAKHKFLCLLSKELEAQKVLIGNYHNNFEDLDYVEFHKSESIGTDDFLWVKFNFKALKTWIDTQISLLTPKLHLQKLSVNTTASGDLARFITQSHPELKLDPIVVVDQVKKKEKLNPDSPLTFKQDWVHVNRPEMFVAVIVWLSKEGIIKNKPKELMTWLGLIDLKKHRVRKMYDKKDDPMWLREHLPKETDAYMRCFFAVALKKAQEEKQRNGMPNRIIERKIAVETIQSTQMSRFTQRMN